MARDEERVPPNRPIHDKKNI